MSKKEAIEELKKDYDLYYSEGVCWADDGTPDGKLLKALEMAILALEKQIPKKIKWQLCKEYCSRDCWYPDYGHEDTWNEKEGYWLEEHSLCPVCKKDFGSSVIGPIKYCPRCGQALDWSEDA